jgi:hypothetical protein
MIDDPKIAKEVSDLMMDLFTRLSYSCEMVRQGCSEQEYKSYIKSTSKVACRIVFDVMEPLYARHPGLKPPNWDDIEDAQQKSE